MGLVDQDANLTPTDITTSPSKSPKPSGSDEQASSGQWNICTKYNSNDPERAHLKITITRWTKNNNFQNWSMKNQG